MFGTTRILREEVECLTKENEKLKEVQRQHKELEDFIFWLNECCKDQHFQIQGVFKLKEPLIGSHYIGFLLGTKKEAWPSEKFHHMIRGFLSVSHKLNDPVYIAEITQNFSKIPDHTNTLWLGDNYLSDEKFFRKGIGSMGIEMIKQFAHQLHCTQISGNRQETKTTKEELIAFYDSVGFEQNEQTDRIVFDMKKYMDSKTMLF